MNYSSAIDIFILLPAIVAACCLLDLRRLAGAKFWLVLLLGLFLLVRSGDRLDIAAFLVSALIINFLSAGLIVRATHPARKLALLWIGLGANVLWLSWFKYGAGLMPLLTPLLATYLPLDPARVPVSHLPLGLSFYTISQCIYLVDVFQGSSRRLDLKEHALCASFFPSFSAGPIFRYNKLLQSGAAASMVGLEAIAERVSKGLFLTSIGLAKKMVFSGPFAQIADLCFSHPGQLSALEVIIGACAFSFQLYFDFSGYSDIARGIAQMLGYQLPNNFSSPFKATSVTDFWTRWHICLSQFITSYLFSPFIRSLGKTTPHKAAAVTMIVMVVVGAWHGSGLNFVLFGALHGAALAFLYYWRMSKIKLDKVAARILTFSFIVAAFMVFRADTMSDLGQLMSALAGKNSLFGVTVLLENTRTEDLLILGAIASMGTAISFLCPNSNELVEGTPLNIGSAVYSACALFIAFVFMNSLFLPSFIYKNF